MKFINLLFFIIAVFFLFLNTEIKKFEKNINDGKNITNLLHLNLDSVDSKPTNIDLKQICDTVIYIPLETKKSCLINEIHEKSFDGNDLFINSGGNLFHYNINGRYLGQIGKKGRGPGELICFTHFLDRKNKRVYAYSHYRSKFMIYSYSGKYISSTPRYSELSFGSTKYIYYRNNKLISTKPLCLTKLKKGKIVDDYKICDMNLNGSVNHQIKSSFLNGSIKQGVKSGMFSIVGNVLYSYNNIIKFQEFSNDTLYEYKNGCLLPKVVFKMPSFQKKYKPPYPSNFVDVNKMASWFSDSYSKYSIKARGENTRFLFISGTDRRYIYFKKDKKLLRINKIYSNTKDDVNMSFSTYNNQYIIDYVSADLFMKNVKLLINNKKITDIYRCKLKSILKRINEESNPVLVLYRLKE
ncbi:6-bladed beta-propeller [Marinilabiliaceae bacterium JC040]|nr:6-bladed beta-propeller [Marinilabiliaceae bacterium JC040]